MIKYRINHTAQKFHSQVYILKRNETCPRRNLHMNVHSSVIHNSQKVETTQVFINKWTNKMWYSHIMEYLVIKWNEVLIHATAWINLENMLSESNQLQKTVYYMIPLIQKSRIGNSTETK